MISAEHEPVGVMPRGSRGRGGGVPMIVPLMDSVSGTPVYINPDYVVALRPDPAALDRISIVKLRDGESIRVVGEHRDVAEKLARTP
jgi:hypothetical protein